MLNIRPPSGINTKQFKKQWTTKKEIRKRPVMPIIIFFPMDEEKAFAILPISFYFFIQLVQKYLKYDLNPLFNEALVNGYQLDLQKNKSYNPVSLNKKIDNALELISISKILVA